MLGKQKRKLRYEGRTFTTYFYDRSAHGARSSEAPEPSRRMKRGLLYGCIQFGGLEASPVLGDSDVTIRGSSYIY